MAELKLNSVFTEISGKLSKKSNITTRTRNDIPHAYEIRNPYKGDPSQSQRTQRNTFTEAVAQTQTILSDPTQLQHWQTLYNQYLQQIAQSPHSTTLPRNAKGRPYSTLRGYIIAILSQTT